ncbi:AfsR/SARP family transcriptional regulator [Actinokineospora enzanensis]|uniref:AfsR/SARP family transcriptional regulator n=1 Tax=Actinokineospora enzanensis TaxID=155975 RepID=UPI001B7F944C|nr:AfsR/SARP family transcriptional regulator [Actinokineospora enzanensis]
MTDVQINLLGPLEVLDEGQDVTPTAPKLRHVLALLAAHANRVVSVDQIIEELWEDRPPFSAMTTLQTYIYQLRKLLRLTGAKERGTGAPDREFGLHTSPTGYLLRIAPDALDLTRFERLAERGRAESAADDLVAAAASLRHALAVWRGPALTDVAAGPTLAVESVRLEEIRKRVLELCVDVELRLGRHHELISELSGIVGRHPTQEGLQGKLMLALYRSGRRTEALQAYQRARTALADELGLEPTPELRRLHWAMLTGDPSIETPAAAGSAPLRELPPDVPELVGRQAQVAAVLHALTPAERTVPPVVVAVGGPGSGKSAFCVHAAVRAAESYPDGQLYARLIGQDGTPVRPEEVLAGFLRTLGVPSGSIPSSVDERSRMFRRWTAGRAILVVLDDLVSRAQLRPLLPTGPGCAVLVASRRTLSDQAISAVVELPPLKPSEAVHLLSQVRGAHRVTAERDAVTELVRLCEGLPLALRAAASRLDLRPHWSIRRLVNRIRDERQRILELSADELDLARSVRQTYRAMPSASRLVLRTLADHGADPVSTRAIATAMDVDESCAEALLEQLVEFQLAEVTQDGASTDFRYRLPALVRIAARALAGQERAEHSTYRPRRTEAFAG